MQVGRIVDLSLPLDPHTQVYPGDPIVEFGVAATLSDDGFNLLSIRMGSQNGTNCDAPYHFLDSGDRIDEVDLRLFAGPALVLDVRGKAPRAAISPDEVRPVIEAFRPGQLLLLHTGWPRHYGTDRYLDHPFLDADACRLLLDAGVRTFCLDAMSIDETPDANHPGAGFPAHHLIARAGGVIVENLCNLERIDFPEPFVTALPLRLTGADGSPTRAVALELLLDNTRDPECRTN